MSELPLKVVQDGTIPASQQSATLRLLHAVLTQAYAPLQEKVEALGMDWGIRSSEFWQQILSLLPALREALDSCIGYTIGRERFPCGFPCEFLAIRYSLLNDLAHAKRLIDDAGIAVTSYKSVCQSMEIPHLRRRQHVLETLRKLVGEVRTALDLMGSQFPMVHQSVTRARAELDEAPEEQRKILSGGDNHAAER